MCLGLVRCEDGPIHSRLAHGPIQILNQSSHTLINTSYGLGPVMFIYIPCLSNNPLIFVGLPYKLLGPVSGVLSLPICRPEILPEITPAGPSPFPIPWSLALI